MRAYPFERLPRVPRADAAVQSAIARWLAARPSGGRVAKLVGGPVSARIVGSGRMSDVDAAACEVRISGESIDVRCAGLAVRRITQHLLGGPPELAAPRALTTVEQGIWALVVAAALEDLGIAGEAWPVFAGLPPAGHGIALVIELAGHPATVVATFREGLELRAAPERPAPRWTDEVPIEATIVLGRCAVTAGALGALAVRDVITLDPPAGTAELALLGGAIGLRAAPGAVVAEACTGYVRRDMSLPDDAHVELTVALGTTQLSLRQVFELAVGQIVQLGRPLAGPFELRAAGRIVGKGELVDVDGELGVRIVSLEK